MTTDIELGGELRYDVDALLWALDQAYKHAQGNEQCRDWIKEAIHYSRRMNVEAIRDALLVASRKG